MKKIILLVAVLFTMLGTFETAKAGWITTKKWSYCWWWWGPNGFTATTHLYQYGCGYGWAWNTNANCYGASSYLSKYWGCFCPWPSSVYAYSYFWGQGGWLYIPCWGVWGGTSNDLLKDAGYADAGDGGGDGSESDPPPSTPGEYRQEKEVTPNMDAAAHNFTLTGIKIRLVSPASDPYDPSGSTDNTVTTTFWTPKDDSTKGVEDSVITKEKTVRSGSVSLKGGEVYVTGDIYSPDDFSREISADGAITVTYVGGDKTVDMPADIDLNSLAFSALGDIKGDEGSAMGKLAATPEGTATLNLYPNPATDMLQLSLLHADAASVTVAIYDLSGKKVKAMDPLSLKNGVGRLSINIATLPAGNYYLMVKGEQLRIVKQFTKQ